MSEQRGGRGWWHEFLTCLTYSGVVQFFFIFLTLSRIADLRTTSYLRIVRPIGVSPGRLTKLVSNRVRKLSRRLFILRTLTYTDRRRVCVRWRDDGLRTQVSKKLDLSPVYPVFFILSLSALSFSLMRGTLWPGPLSYYIIPPNHRLFKLFTALAAQSCVYNPGRRLLISHTL